MKEHNATHYNFYMGPIKKFNIFLAGLVVAAICGLAGCAGVPAVSSGDMMAMVGTVAEVPAGQALPERERLVYRVKWMGITAGEFVVEIKGLTTLRGRRCYLLEVTARTTGFAASIYRARSVFRSYFDAEKFYSLRHEEKREEGGYRKDAVTDFDHEAGKAYFSNAVDGSKKVFDIPAGVQDSLTVAYAARLVPLEPGRVILFKTCNSERVYDLYLSVGPRSKVMGQAVLHLIPYGTINGREYREGRASGYVTDDARRVPLMFVVKAPVFTSVTARLVE